MKNPALIHPKLWEFLLLLFSRSTFAISIGSGNGTTEQEIWENTGAQIITVDPAPLSYQNKGILRPPTHPTVDHFLRSSSAVPSVALFNWPTPNLHQWDVDAISKLCARGTRRFILVLETCGGAGSLLLNWWLQHRVKQEGFTLAYCDKLVHSTGDKHKDEAIQRNYSQFTHNPSPEELQLLSTIPQMKISRVEKQEKFVNDPRLELQGMLLSLTNANPDLKESGWAQSCWAVIELQVV